ncbi:MAG: OsmC family protein [Anaerolineae bacterium]|nr:OsmC family protein [Anaerolineae bacterium]MDW8071719.1 OsmC family protein [Anaerolineae bacterium]
MAQATVTLVDGMQFVAETPSGHAFIIDAISDVGGRNTGPRPMELLAAGVAGCTAMDVIAILRKMQQKVTGLRVHVNGEQAAEHPKRFTSIHIQYTVTGYGVAEDKVARAIELSQTKYCSALASLQPGTPITFSYTILEASPETTTK